MGVFKFEVIDESGKLFSHEIDRGILTNQELVSRVTDLARPNIPKGFVLLLKESGVALVYESTEDEDFKESMRNFVVNGGVDIYRIIDIRNENLWKNGEKEILEDKFLDILVQGSVRTKFVNGEPKCYLRLCNSCRRFTENYNLFSKFFAYVLKFNSSLLEGYKPIDWLTIVENQEPAFFVDSKGEGYISKEKIEEAARIYADPIEVAIHSANGSIERAICDIRDKRNSCLGDYAKIRKRFDKSKRNWLLTMSSSDLEKNIKEVKNIDGVLKVTLNLSTNHLVIELQDKQSIVIPMFASTFGVIDVAIGGIKATKVHELLDRYWTSIVYLYTEFDVPQYSEIAETILIAIENH